MTLAEMSSKMSNAEFELWVALAAKRANECPNCGHEANEMMEYEQVKMHCPICATDYHKTASVQPFKFQHQDDKD